MTLTNYFVPPTILEKVVKTYGWIPAFAGMTRRETLFSIESTQRSLWIFEWIASLFVIPAKAGIQMKLFYRTVLTSKK